MSKAMAGEGPRIPHLAPGTSEVGDLRLDLEASFERLEAQTDYPSIEYVDAASAMSLAGLPLALVIHGDALLQDQEFASYQFGDVGAAGAEFEANRPGTPGNDITVELETGAAEAVAVVGSDVTVTLNTGVSTPATIKALVEGDADAKKLVHVNISGGGGDPIAVAAQQSLAGGEGEGLEVLVKGNDVDVIAKSPSAGTITAQISGMTGAGAGDVVQCRVKTNGLMSDSIGLHLTA
jgi:hypothetical protein